MRNAAQTLAPVGLHTFRTGREGFGIYGQREAKLATITEIAPDVFRISVFIPEINFEFSHFLIRDDEPLLYHAGVCGMFPALR